METECIEWQGAKTNSGYGIRTIKRKNWLAHRWAYTEKYGPIPDGLLVRHKCDNKLCVNPEHLELGNKSDNTKDAIERGQHKIGSQCRNAKLNEENVKEILADKVSTHTKLAKKYNVCRTIIADIRKRERWKHVK